VDETNAVSYDANIESQRRLVRALDLLIHSEMSLCEIAAITGYADSEHLMRRFRLAIGVTPLRYRHQHHWCRLGTEEE